MKVGFWAAASFALTAAPAAAADWWWVGINGTAPNRQLTYIDRETVAPASGGTVEIWVLVIGEFAYPNGEQHRAMHYAFKCRQRMYSVVSWKSYDSSGKVMPAMVARPTKFIPVAAGSIGESVMRVACGNPSGTELHVDLPMPHARAYFTGQGQAAQRSGNQPQGQAEEPGISVGTGFFVGPEGYVLTSYHVVADADRIGCRSGSGPIHDATVARMSPANDLALLKVAVRPAQYLSFAAPGSLHPGDRVFTIGYGAANFLGVDEPRFTDGTVSALSGPGAENAYMQISVPVQPGNSGGPLVNESGQVVGIIAAQAATEEFMRVEGTLPQNINWAVKAEYASPLMSPMPVPPRRTRAQAIELARNSICLVVAAKGQE
jgi:S1-C subfamily serine protease